MAAENVDDGDADDTMTPHDIFMIQTRCKYLSIFLKLCMEQYDRKKMKMITLAKEAVLKIKELEYYEEEDTEDIQTTTTYHERTILDWYTKYKKGYCFATHPPREIQTEDYLTYS